MNFLKDPSNTSLLAKKKKEKEKLMAQYIKLSLLYEIALTTLPDEYSHVQVCGIRVGN